MQTQDKPIKFLMMLGFAGICLSTFVSIIANCEAQASSELAAPAGSLPPPPPPLAPALAQPPTAPVAAPDLATKSARYVKQTAVMDTPSADAASAAGKAMAPDLKTDLGLVSSLTVAGWEGLEPLKLSLAKKSLVTPDGKAVEDVQGKQASILVEYGCTDAVSRRFRRGQRYCEISIARFAGSDGAYGAYTTMRSGSSTVVIRGQGSSEDEDSISFFSGNALVFLHSTSEGDDEAKGMLGHLADQVAPHLSGGAPAVPRLLQSLPYVERVTGSEKFFMGPQAACRYSSIQFLDSLQLEQSHGAACVDYQYSRPMAERLKLIVAEFANQSLAQSAFSSYSAAMSEFSRKTIAQGPAEMLCKMADSYLMCGMTGAKVWVISGARRASSPRVLAREL